MYKAAALLILYALLMIAVGVVTFIIAPPGAKALTALLIPGIAGALAIACGVLCIIGANTPEHAHDEDDDEPRAHSSGKAVMIGVHGGLVLPLVLALAFGWRAWSATSKLLDARAVLGTPDQAVVDEQISAAVTLGEDELKKADKAINKDYLAASLWGLTGLSVMAFGGILGQRPRGKRA